jgi:hypothetical protein
MGRDYCFYSSFSSPQISSTSSRNPQLAIRNAQMEQQNRQRKLDGKRQASLTLRCAGRRRQSLQGIMTGIIRLGVGPSKGIRRVLKRISEQIWKGREN